VARDDAPNQGRVLTTRAYEGRPGVELMVDLLCAGTPLEREALRRRRSASMFGVDIWVIGPDDLLLYKLIANRPQDLADVDELIRFGRAPEDLEYVRQWARDWEIEDRLDRSLDLASRPRTTYSSANGMAD
jgi:hypothetical protein